LSTSSRLISFPFTTAHTSGACRASLLQPAAAANTIAARGSHAAARFTPFECFIGCPTERSFAMVKFKVGGSGGFRYTAESDARRANADLLPHARHNRAHALQVRIPPAPPRVIRVADHISKMRRFAAELTLQCHFSSCSKFSLGLGFPLEISQNQATYSNRPSTSGKVRCLWSGRFFGARAFAGRWFCRSVAPLFFRTGLESVVRTSNPSNRVEATGFAGKKGVPLAARTIVGLVLRV